ncbi:MAG: prepilin-type N-terminal cleavage/methylation domain-containing protein [Acidobacteria bacterium]|nr:prepilin-type N-terminal cleavage/methylation domain-containing protein [Acidobacteriota bacterium]
MGIMKIENRYAGYTSKENRQGFTLIELVMIIVIIGIIAIVATPKLLSISDTRVRKDAKLMLNYLTFAQELAMSRSQPYGICLDTGNSRYTVNKTDCTSTANIIPSPEDRVSPLQIQYDSSFTISPSGTTSIFFDYLGRPTPNGATLTFSSGNVSVSIKVEANTGYVHEL